MCRRISFATVLWFAAVAVAADDAAALKPLQGMWKVTAAELGGRPLGGDFMRTTKLTIQGDRYTVMAESPDKGTLKVDASQSPKTMDVIGGEGPNKGKTILAIYEIKGDTLRICYDLSGKSRPTEFKSKPDTPLFLATYQREKRSVARD